MQPNKTIIGLVLEGEREVLDNVLKNLERYPTVKLLYVRRQRYEGSFMLVLEMKRKG